MEVENGNQSNPNQELRKLKQKEKKMFLLISQKQQEIDNLDHQIEDTTKFYDYLQYNTTDSIIDEELYLRQQIVECEQKISEKSIRLWDTNTLTQKNQDQINVTKQFYQSIQEINYKDEQNRIKNKIEQFRQQLKQLDQEIQDLIDKHHESTDNFSYIKKQLRQQQEKNQKLKSEIQQLKKGS